MQYEDAKTFLLGCEWPNIPKYQKERETSETNSSKKSIGFEFANGRQLALGTTKKTKIWIENFAEKLPHPSYLTYFTHRHTDQYVTYYCTKCCWPKEKR